MGCQNSSSKKELEMNTEKETNVSCLRPELFECVSNYISNVDGTFIPGITPFYSLYFFKRDKKKYFTIWVFTTFPNYIESINPKLKFKYYLTKVKDNNLIIIEYRDSINNELTFPCINDRLATDKINIESELAANYDGSWYPKTFSYKKEKDRYIIKELDTIIADMLGEHFIQFENYIRKYK